jgi:HEAT repeat protein
MRPRIDDRCRVGLRALLVILLTIASIRALAQNPPEPCDANELRSRINWREQRSISPIVRPRPDDYESPFESPLETPPVEVLSQRLVDGVQLDCTILYLTYLGPQAKKAAPAVFRFLLDAPTDLHSTLVAKIVGRWGIASIYDLYHAGGDRMTPFIAYALMEVPEPDAFDRLLRGLTTGAPLPKVFSHAVLRELVLNEVDQRVGADARPHFYGKRGIAAQPLHPTFLRCLDANDCDFRSLSAFMIGLVSEAEKQKAVEPLRRALADASADVRFAAAISLATLGDTTVQPHLVDALQHGETDARRFAAAILVKQDPSAPQLAVALKDADRVTRSIAAHAFIGKQVPAEALPVFREMLGDSNHEFAAADGLAKAAPASVPFLVDALQDRNPDVRSRAAWAISFIRDESSRKTLLPRLVDRIGDSDAEVRKSVIDSIADLAGPGTPDIVDPLLPLLEMPDLRGNAARALSRVGRGDARVPALLVARARSQDAAIARDGAVALTSLAPLSDDELDAISAALSVDNAFSEKARQSEFDWLGPIESQLIAYWSKTALQADDAAAQRVAGLLIARSDEGALSTFITVFKDPARRGRGTAFIRQWAASPGSSTFDTEILRRRALAEPLTEILKLGDLPSRSAAARLLAVTHQVQDSDYLMCRQEFDSEDSEEDVEPTLTLLSWQQRVEPVLQRLVTEGVDSGDRAAAAVLLRAMGVSNDAVHDALVAALDDPEPFIRLFAASTVIHVRPGNRAALNLILQEQSHGKLYDTCLEQAVEPMPKDVKAPTLDAWHELLAASHDDAFRLTAASQLIKVDPTSTLARQVLVELAHRQNETALAALMRSGTAGIESIDYLIGRLSDGQWKEAVEALARIGDPTFDPLLRAALDGSDAAASALGAVFSAPSLPRLETLLDDQKTIRIGIRALETAGEAAAPAVVKLRTIMLSGNPHANAAAWALTEITPDSRDALPYQCRSIAQTDSFPDVRFGKTLARFGFDGVAELAAAVRSSGLSERDAVACVHDAIVFGEEANAEGLKKAANNSAVTAAVRTLIARAMEK